MLLFVVTSTRADDASSMQAECVRSYEAAQELQLESQLQSARQELKICMQDHCRDFIRSACRGWFEEVDAATPSVVFAVRQDGKDLSDVRVFQGDELLTETVDGRAIELDPGPHTFRLETASGESITQEVLIRAGEKTRIISVEFPAETVASAKPIPEPIPESIHQESERSLVLPLALAGAGVVGIVSFATFGALGRKQESRLEERCAPDCSANAVRTVRRRYVLADISLGAGLVALAVSGYFLFRPKRGDEAKGRLKVDVHPSPQGTTATVRGRF